MALIESFPALERTRITSAPAFSKACLGVVGFLVDKNPGGRLEFLIDLEHFGFGGVPGLAIYGDTHRVHASSYSMTRQAGVVGKTVPMPTMIVAFVAQLVPNLQTLAS